MTPEIFLSLLAATVQSGTPILYATLGEILTEKGGILNLGVEGIMLVGALAAFLTALHTGSPTLAFAAGGLAGALLAAVHGVICIWFLGNQIVSGLALTILGAGRPTSAAPPPVSTSSLCPCSATSPFSVLFFFSRTPWFMSRFCCRRSCGPFSGTPAGVWP